MWRRLWGRITGVTFCLRPGGRAGMWNRARVSGALHARVRPHGHHLPAFLPAPTSPSSLGPVFAACPSSNRPQALRASLPVVSESALGYSPSALSSLPPLHGPSARPRPPAACERPPAADEPRDDGPR